MNEKEEEDIGKELEEQLENIKRSQEYSIRIKRVLKDLVREDLGSFDSMEEKLVNAPFVQAQISVALAQILGETIIEYTKEIINKEEYVIEQDEDSMKGYS